MRTAALVATLAAVGIAAADPAADRRADALAAEGRRLAAAHDYKGACARLGEAIEAAPNAVETMLDLGMCNERLRKFATALSWFRRARAFAKSHGLPKVEASAASHADDVADLVTIATISFRRTPPDEINVMVDGYPVPSAGYGHVELDQGHHAIDVTAPRYVSFHSELDVDDSDPVKLDVDLRPVGRDEPPRRRDEPITEPPPPARQDHLVRDLGIAGGAALVASATVVLYAHIKYAECVDSRGQPLPRCADGHDGIDGANHYRDVARWGATPLFLAGAGLLGGAAYIYFHPPPPSKHHVSWAPIIGVDGVGVAAAGSF